MDNYMCAQWILKVLITRGACAGSKIGQMSLCSLIVKRSCCRLNKKHTGTASSLNRSLS